jgi:hypothetical protein
MSAHLTEAFAQSLYPRRVEKGDTVSVRRDG